MCITRIYKGGQWRNLLPSETEERDEPIDVTYVVSPEDYDMMVAETDKKLVRGLSGETK